MYSFLIFIISTLGSRIDLKYISQLHLTLCLRGGGPHFHFPLPAEPGPLALGVQWGHPGRICSRRAPCLGGASPSSEPSARPRRPLPGPPSPAWPIPSDGTTGGRLQGTKRGGRESEGRGSQGQEGPLTPGTPGHVASSQSLSISGPQFPHE